MIRDDRDTHVTLDVQVLVVRRVDRNYARALASMSNAVLDTVELKVV